MHKPIKIEGKTATPAIDIALDTIKIGKQALVFVNTKSSAEKLAEDIAAKIKSEDKKHIELSEKLLKALPSPTKQCRRLGNAVKKGIAFHHAGLHHEQKDIIERSFREGVIKVICSTPTLALGVDLPAFRAIIRDVKRYGGAFGMNWIPVLEYHQQAGRAGRPKFDSYGEAILIASSEGEKENLTEKYIKGEPEEIYSKLAVEPALRTYLLSLIASEFVDSREKIICFFEKTFWAYQYRDMRALSKIIDRMLRLLDEYEFIAMKGKDSDFVSAGEVIDEKINATMLGRRVAQLYLDPLTAHHIINGIKRSSSVMATPFVLLQLICNTLEMRPLLNVRNADADAVNEKLIEYSNSMLDLEPNAYDPEYEQFLCSVKTAIMMEDWVNEVDEESLLEKYNTRPGETRSKLLIADWLLYSTEELARLLNFNEMIKEVIKLRLRLKYGAKEELLALLKLKNIGRVRARKLFNNRIKDIEDVKNADISTLSQLIGREVALGVKKQVGQDLSKLKVKENKRKGQISIEDYREE